MASQAGARSLPCQENPQDASLGWPRVHALALDWGDVVHGTAGAPWVWWAVSLVVILLILLGALKLLGLFPD